MNKTKVKISIFILLSLIGLTVGFFFAGYLNLLLSGGNIDNLSDIQPAKLLAGLVSDERQRMLTLCVELVIETGTAAFTLLSRKETFESDTADITKGIKTPIAIGQGQHGTARWMAAAEKRTAFSVYRLNKNEKLYSDLLLAGKQDAQEVVKYNEMPETKEPEKASNRANETPVSKQSAEKSSENH